MHNNYYFLRQLCLSLQPILQDAVVSECFSQSKEELIVRFETYNGSFFIKAGLSSTLSCLTFSDEFHRARKNSVDLFPDLIGLRIKSIRQFENERSFSFILSEGFELIFKMHGNRSNILLFQHEVIKDLFKKNLKSDHKLKPGELDRQIDWSLTAFLPYENKPSQLYFTFGKIVWEYVEKSNYKSLSKEEKWNFLLSIKSKLESPEFLICNYKTAPILSLIEVGEVEKRFTDPIKAANEFYYTFTHAFTFIKEKNLLLARLTENIKSGENYIRKNFAKLKEIEGTNNYKVWADVLMANLHDAKPGSEKITLRNFYNEDKPIEIKLKKDLTAQKNAEVFYRKAKNQAIEIQHLDKSIKIKEDQLKELRSYLQQVQNAEDLKFLREIKKTVEKEQPSSDDSPLPYHLFEYKGFKIMVGKNALSNDILTQKFGFKEDLWLHAKDVTGSHVLIKHQAGKNFPKDVIEHAAQIAAYNSKRRNETLCPVIVTPKKFVRKRKGDVPGAVVVEREEVILVEPKLPL